MTFGCRHVLFVLLAIAMAPGPALAQEHEYAEIIADAVSEFDAHRFAEARALFWQAHALLPSARTERGIALASFELRDYVETYRMLVAALADTRRPLTARQREEAEALLDRTRHFLGIFALEVEPRDASLELDGTSIEREPDGALLVPLGTHRLTVRSPGHRAEERSIVVAGGEHDTLRVALAADGEPAVPPPEEAVSAAPGEGADPTLPIALLVGGGVLAATAIVLTFAWWLDADQQTGVCQMGGPACDNLSQLTLERAAAATVSIGLGVVAVAGLAWGAVLLALDQRGETSSSLRCLPAGPGIACGGTF